MTEDYGALLKRLFYPGADINIELVAERNLVSYYSTRVEDLEKEYLVLQAPMSKGEYLQLEEGREITLWCEEEQEKQAYVTSVFVIENRHENTPLLVCCKPQRFERSSLRRFSRYEVDLSCICTANGITASGRVTDISLGGCCVELDLDSTGSGAGAEEALNHMKAGLYLHTVVTIPDQPELVFSGQLARVFEVDGKTAGLALEIREISPDSKEILKNYLFQLQLMNC